MEILIPAEDIRKRVEQLAAEIAQAYEGRPVTVVGVLNGCLIFMADLIRRIDLPLRVGVAFVPAGARADRAYVSPTRISEAERWRPYPVKSRAIVGHCAKL